MPVKLDKLVINGGKPLQGTVSISGSKNATLPLMTAALLAPGRYTFFNVPDLTDVKTMCKVMRTIGAICDFENHLLTIETTKARTPEVPYELMKTMRASIYAMGPLLARFGEAKVSLPGGCAWGPRPVDLHLKGFEKMGAKIELDGGYIYATAKKLTGAYINFDISSVGATGNLMMAAVLAQGKTTLENAAREPEITALAQFLNKMGAKISGIGTDILEIEGVNSLQPHSETVIPDRIEAATFLVAGAITGGEITIEGVIPGHLSAVLTKLEDAGCMLGRPETAKSDSPAVETNRIKLTASSTINPISATTAVYPGFPTDMQAQWMALMSLANGSSVITDTIYTDRFTHVAELTRFGADIKLDKNTAIITGVKQLKGAPVMSTDLRASASLILAGLAAQGRTDVLRIYHLDRGYEHIEMKLKKLGAEIRREEGTL